MPINLKALIVVLGIALPIFHFARPFCLHFMVAVDFARRRNLWLFLTTIAFVSPSFWLFAVVALLTIFIANRRDNNPVALYLLLMQVVLPVGLQLPVVGINQLFELNSYRILALAILIPAFFRQIQNYGTKNNPTSNTVHWLILAFALLQIILLIPYESPTNTLRRTFLYGIDALVIYFVVVRTCITRQMIQEAMACFCLVGLIYAVIAVFEGTRSWLLYAGIGQAWIPDAVQYQEFLQRDGVLRAQASAGHALALGYILSMALGFWMALQSNIRSNVVRYSVILCYLAGLLTAYSRGPWFVAAVVFYSFIGLAPNGKATLTKAALISVAIGIAALLSPIGEKIIDNLPFVGTVDADTVTYRQQFAAAAWQLILQNPLFGDANILLYLEALRQGQGIIDLINAYLTIAMYYGLVGLCLFIGVFLVGIRQVLKSIRSFSAMDKELAGIGAAIVACMLGTMLMLATGSFGTSLEKMFFILAGFAVAFTRISDTECGAAKRNAKHVPRMLISPTHRACSETNVA